MSAKKEEKAAAGAPAVEGWGPFAVPAMPDAVIDAISAKLLAARDEFQPYAARVGPRDRQRLRGIGVKKLGFIMQALGLAAVNPRVLPADVPVETFQKDVERFEKYDALVETCKELLVYARNRAIIASDKAYIDARAFYNAAEDGAKRGRDAETAIHRELAPYFQNMGRKEARKTAAIVEKIL
jgi:hypothetical protein